MNIVAVIAVGVIVIILVSLIGQAVIYFMIQRDKEKQDEDKWNGKDDDINGDVSPMSFRAA